MKNTFLKKIGAASLAILMLVTFAKILVSAQDSFNEERTENELFKARQNERTLEGTWNAQVTVRNCQTGATFATFPAIATFMFGGTAIVSETSIPPALKTPAHGVWSRTNGNTFPFGNTYRFKTKAFNFDAGGNFTGWTIINQEANLNRRADKYESTGSGEFYNTNGTLIFTGCSTTTATRFE